MPALILREESSGKGKTGKKRGEPSGTTGVTGGVAQSSKGSLSSVAWWGPSGGSAR